jgi:hypothetical protein
MSYLSLYSPHPVDEGRFSRASLEVGQDAAPADVPRKHGLGRSWVAVRAHYGALPLAAGRVRVKAGESRPDDGHDARTQYPEARPREQKSCDGAPKGVRAPKVAVAGSRRAAPLITKLRLSALYPPYFRRGTTGRPTCAAARDRRRVRASIPFTAGTRTARPAARRIPEWVASNPQRR